MRLFLIKALFFCIVQFVKFHMSIVNSDLHDREFATPKFAVNKFFVAEKAPQVGCEKIRLESLRTFVVVMMK
jgi:hypothetical protein